MKTLPVANTAQNRAGTSPLAKTSKLKNKTNNINNIRALPPCVLVKIAHQLPVRDYNRLRLSCSHFAKELMHIRGIVNKYYSRPSCAEEIKRVQDNLLFSAIMEKASEHTKSGLKGRKIQNYPLSPITSSSSSLIISPSLLPSPILPPSFSARSWFVCLSFPRDREDGQPEEYMANQLLHKMQPELNIDSNSILVSTSIDVEISFSLNLYTYALNEALVSNLFSKANSLFNKDKKDGGLLLAALMSSIYQYFSTIRFVSGPRKFSDELLSRYRRDYNEMFVSGDIINQFYPPVKYD